MNAYPDTSFLCALYRFQPNSTIAARHAAQMTEALHVASPLLFEFRQAMRWQSYLHSKDPAKGFDRVSAQTALAKLQANTLPVASSVAGLAPPLDFSPPQQISPQ